MIPNHCTGTTSAAQKIKVNIILGLNVILLFLFYVWKLILFYGSVYFEVKTSIEAATDKKLRKAEKTSSNFELWKILKGWMDKRAFLNKNIIQSGNTQCAWELIMIHKQDT